MVLSPSSMVSMITDDAAAARRRRRRPRLGEGASPPAIEEQTGRLTHHPHHLHFLVYFLAKKANNPPFVSYKLLSPLPRDPTLRTAFAPFPHHLELSYERERYTKTPMATTPAALLCGVRKSL